jgi:stearoyl-CoA desaturase (delta-9 desaturase)
LHTYYYGLTVGAFAMAALLAVLGGLGVTVGFHRLFTHRSFEATPWTRNILVMLGSMAAQHHFFLWVANHRRHHHFSDHEGDPHSPHSLDLKKEGRWSALFRSHISWVFSSKLSDYDLRYIPDLTSNIALCRIPRLYVLWIGLGLLAPALVCYFIGGTLQAAVGGMLWGGFARMFLSTQTTNAVNSICHMWGGQPYESHDFSRNNGTVAMLSLGEGWHNNHHAFPTSA